MTGLIIIGAILFCAIVPALVAEYLSKEDDPDDT